MLRNRTSRMLLAAAAAITLATAITAAGAAASTGAASPRSLPRLAAPGLHPRSTAKAAATDACDYHAAIPADRFKGIPVFNAAKAAKPYDVRFFTTQGVITVRMLTERGTVYHVLVPVPREPRLLQPHPLPPPHRAVHLRAAVR